MKYKFWELKQKTSKLFFNSPDLKKKMSKVKASILFIFFGLVCGAIILGINGNNPLLFLKETFRSAFAGPFKDDTLTYVSAYIIGGLALAIGFRTKIFNIGVTGQMMIAGFGTAIFAILATHYDSTGNAMGLTMNKGLLITLCLLFSIVSGMVLAILIALLKIFFRIHEVVPSIMFNFIVFYFGKWFIETHPRFYSSAAGSTHGVSTNFNFDIGGYSFVFPLIIALICCVIIFILLKYSVFGRKIQTVGLSLTTASYSGINVSKNILMSFAISGALSGLMGFVYYVGIQHTQVVFNGQGVLPSIGFNSIAVSLVAFNDALGVIPVAFVWGVFQHGMQIASYIPTFGLSNQIANLIFGIIIYGAAAASLFVNLKLFNYFIKTYFRLINKKFLLLKQKHKTIIYNHKTKLKYIKKHKDTSLSLKGNWIYFWNVWYCDWIKGWAQINKKVNLNTHKQYQKRSNYIQSFQQSKTIYDNNQQTIKDKITYEKIEIKYKLNQMLKNKKESSRYYKWVNYLTQRSKNIFVEINNYNNCKLDINNKIYNIKIKNDKSFKIKELRNKLRKNIKYEKQNFLNKTYQIYNGWNSTMTKNKFINMVYLNKSNLLDINLDYKVKLRAYKGDKLANKTKIKDLKAKYKIQKINSIKSTKELKRNLKVSLRVVKKTLSDFDQKIWYIRKIYLFTVQYLEYLKNKKEQKKQFIKEKNIILKTKTNSNWKELIKKEHQNKSEEFKKIQKRLKLNLINLKKNTKFLVKESK